MAYFLGGYRYDKDPETLAAVRPEHRDYLRTLLSRGQLVLAGPMAEGDEGRIVYRADSAADVAELIAADPYVLRQAATPMTPVEWTIVVHQDGLG